MTGPHHPLPSATHQLAVAGTRLAVHTAGSGIPLVLLHAFPLDHSMWALQEPLAEQVRLIAPDLRGFGFSDAALPETIAAWADDVVAVLDALHVRGPAVICGISMGGYVAQHVAARHPDRVAALILVDTRLEADSAEARAAVVVPCRMQLDVAGNATGRPRPVTLGPGEVELDDLDRQERDLVERLLGAVAGDERSVPPPLERRTISRIVISPRSAAAHLALLCETGRLVMQPEPRRAPDDVVPLTWDGGRPWEFAFVVGPDDDDLPRRRREAEAEDDDAAPPPPAKATLTAALVRGSQRKDLREPRAILKSGIVVFADRIARLEAAGAAGWIDQFERRGPIELAGGHCDGLIERLALLADLPRIVLPAWTGWPQPAAGAPGRPDLVRLFRHPDRGRRPRRRRRRRRPQAVRPP
ncbi:MAG: alpha/beta fold hydrolase [Planctomycetia bacterium]|nr:alpha/beta fold hydrolase [Planctomycetia bacterium]